MSEPDDDLPPLDVYLDDPLIRYSTLAFRFNVLIDRGESMTVEEVQERLDDGTLLDWVEERSGMTLGLDDYDRALALGAIR